MPLPCRVRRAVRTGWVCGGVLAAGFGFAAGCGRVSVGTTRGSDFGLGATAGFVSGLSGAMVLTALGDGHPGLPGDVLQSGAASQDATSIRAADRTNPAVIDPVPATHPSIPVRMPHVFAAARMENLLHSGGAGQLVLKGW